MGLCKKIISKLNNKLPSISPLLDVMINSTKANVHKIKI